MFVVSTSQTDVSIANRIQVAYSYDGVYFDYLGVIPDAITKFPVGASYDYLTDRFVIAWANHSDRAQLFASANNATTCDTAKSGVFNGYPFGCKGETIVSTILSGGSPVFSTTHIRLAYSDPQSWGLKGLGPPTVNCDSGAPYYQCEIFITDHSQAMDIVSRRFCLFSGGLPCGSQALIHDPGLTDFPVTTTQRRANGSGGIVLTARALDDRFYYNTKTSIAASWTGWTVVSSTPITSTPSIELPSNSGNYEAFATFP